VERTRSLMQGDYQCSYVIRPRGEGWPGGQRGGGEPGTGRLGGAEPPPGISVRAMSRPCGIGAR